MALLLGLAIGAPVAVLAWCALDWVGTRIVHR